MLRSVRFKIVLLLLVPLVSLSALWAFAASITLGDGLNLLHVNTIQDHLGYPSGALGSALEQERRLSMVYLGSHSAGDRAAMESGRLATDRQVEQFRRLASDKGTLDATNSQARDWTQQILRDLDNLPARRREVDSGAVNRSQVFNRYTDPVDAINSLQSSLSTLSDPEVTKDAKTQVALARAREVLSQEDALLSGALAAGQVTFTEHVQFTKLVGTQHSRYAEVVPDLRSDDRALYQRITSTPEYSRLQSLENRFTDHMPAQRQGRGMANASMAVIKPPAGTDVEWKTTVSSILTRFRGLELSSTAQASDRSKPIATGIILRVALAGALGLVAVIASLVLSLWVGRSVIRDLTGLRRAALDLANERLPGVIRRLRRGEDVDVGAEAPPLSFGTDEIDQVGQAFNAARRTAIQGAVEEATLRKSISEVFLNLARRNQALLHRQLSLLDTMERRIAEPDELEDLFRLDHLATRMRRHAEGLIILSGQAPGRGWRNPVPAVDVARAAAAEVEDYARVTVATMPRVAVSGPSVADLIHLLAELIENATLFSPPDTTVQVTGQLVAHGFAIEVEDRGLSMDPESLAQANQRLAEPPDFDLSNSAQLGLFVVGRLAQRHSIQVTLRTSPYGGTTAIVLLPENIVVRSGEQPEIESGDRLAVTRRAEDALIPIGAIGPPAYANGTSDTGPMPLTRGERPPLPQRHHEVTPAEYETGPAEPPRYGADPYAAPPAAASPGQYEPGQYDAGHDTAQYQTGQYDTGQYDTGQYDTGQYDTGQFDTGQYDTGQYQPGQYDAGAQEPAGHYDAAPYEPGGYDSNAYESYDSGRYDSAGYSPAESGGYDTGRYDDGSNTGQWVLPSSDAEERPPLPQRHADPVDEASPLSRLQPDGDLSRRSVFEPAVEEDAAAAPDGAPAPQPGPASSGRDDKPSLPRRVRQANLAPQLRDEVEPVGDTANGDRSPEELRTMLSSIQKGWLRGRSDAEQTASGHEQEDN